MGCQKQIASEISSAQADYVLALKGNQSTRHEEVASFLEDAQANDFEGVTHGFLETTARAHGRMATRRYWISEEIQWLTHHAQWKDLRSVGMVESIRDMPGKRTSEVRYFIASIGANAETFARAVRGHWAIENTLLAVGHEQPAALGLEFGAGADQGFALPVDVAELLLLLGLRKLLMPTEYLLVRRKLLA